MESLIFIENKIGEIYKKKSWFDFFRFICLFFVLFNMFCLVSLRFLKLKVIVCKKILYVFYIFFDLWIRIFINLINKVFLSIFYSIVWMLRKVVIGWWGLVWFCEG